ncbi:serine/threonine-protein kinase [Niveibacterium sp. SC-1]|uniref:serine/threonine-protein kinase n=1 Tax=Niveibacterium sp. SC-1 TaxID=3135646 RepID=UPI00311E5678
MSAATPERIGKYPIRRRLGEGAMGIVFEAFDPVIQRPLAIKTIRRQLIEGEGTGPMAVARFKNEAKAAGRLAHPGIAAVYEYGEDQDFAYIAMEFVAGNTLREYLDRKVEFPEEDVVSVMFQLLDALEYAHHHGVWHRDIKPANLMVTGTGQVKVTDFGIARIEANGLTLDGSMLGTPGFMAPEQFSGEGIDQRIDIYAAGALLYQLLTGAPPFSGTLESVMYRTVTQEAPTLSSHAQGARWRHFEGVVAKALARDRDLRFRSAREFKQALVEASHGPVNAAITDSTVVLGQEAIAMAMAAYARQGARRQSEIPTQQGEVTGTPVPVHASTQGANQTQFDARTLSLFEADLARHVGPMAKLLVRRAAGQAVDVESLRDLLANHLENADDRTAFLSAHAALGSKTGGAGKTLVVGSAAATAATGGGGTGSSQAQTRAHASLGGSLMAQPLTPDIVDRAALLLAARMGPIARVLVKKAASKAPDVEALLREIAATVDQADFDLPSFRRDLMTPKK